MREKDKKRDNHLFTLAITTISHWKLVLPPIHLNAWPEEPSFKKEVSGFLMRIGFVQEVECHLKNLNLTHKRMHSHRLLKIKVHYWHWWFHEELLTSMEPFHSTKGSLCWKKGSLDSNVLCNKKNVFFLECFTERFFGEPKRLFSPMASLWKPLFLETFIFNCICWKRHVKLDGYTSVTTWHSWHFLPCVKVFSSAFGL